MNPHYDYKEREIEPMGYRGFRVCQGKISGALAFSLVIMSLLAVLCFKYPVYFTTAELRAAYDTNFLREVLKWGIYAALLSTVIAFMIGKYRRLPGFGVLFGTNHMPCKNSYAEYGTVNPLPRTF